MPERTRVLVTGAGGPAGVAVIRSLAARLDVDVVAADMDRYASGLYLVPAAERRLIPPGLALEFVDEVVDLCRRDDIDVVFPTVDVELPRLAAHRAELLAYGIRLASPSVETLDVTLDKLALARRCAEIVRVPRTELLDANSVLAAWAFPVIVKPRRGAGSRGVRLVADQPGLAAIRSDEDLLVQEFLPGEEYSVDVLADLLGRVIAAVPRSRLRVDSGVSVAGITIHDAELEDCARAVATAIGLTTVANVQLRRDVHGRAALLEVNPRFPGAMPLTIAAGVDMPSLTLDLVLGLPVPRHLGFREIAAVRYLEDRVLDISELLPERAPVVIGALTP